MKQLFERRTRWRSAFLRVPCIWKTVPRFVYQWNRMRSHKIQTKLKVSVGTKFVTLWSTSAVRATRSVRIWWVKYFGPTSWWIKKRESKHLFDQKVIPQLFCPFEHKDRKSVRPSSIFGQPDMCPNLIFLNRSSSTDTSIGGPPNGMHTLLTRQSPDAFAKHS